LNFLGFENDNCSGSGNWLGKLFSIKINFKFNFILFR
jgi:hypothetical protein